MTSSFFAFDLCFRGKILDNDDGSNGGGIYTWPGTDRRRDNDAIDKKRRALWTRQHRIFWNAWCIHESKLPKPYRSFESGRSDSFSHLLFSSNVMPWKTRKGRQGSVAKVQNLNFAAMEYSRCIKFSAALCYNWWRREMKGARCTLFSFKSV